MTTKKELQTEIRSLEDDYAQAVRERDTATRALDKIEGMQRLQERAKEQAKIQEKVDGIRAGLIPVEDLRHHVRETFEVTMNGGGSKHDFKLFFRQGDTNPVSIAIRDAILGPLAPKPSSYEEKLAFRIGLLWPCEVSDVL